MFRYILRRCAYSVLIMLGVLILTFTLFRVAAGDPAATVLGKNPSAEELEAMRDQLGSSKPLFFGRWKETEAYASADFSGGRESLPGVAVSGKTEASENGMILQPGAEVFCRRNFDRAGVKAEIRPESPALTLSLGKDGCTVRNGSDRAAVLQSVRFFVPTDGLFDSQLGDSVRELVCFRKSFPFVSFFNFGDTLLTRTPIREVLWDGMWTSLLLMVPIFFGELITGIVLAMLSAVFRDSWIDRSIMVLSVAGMSVSYLALIIFSQWLLGYYWNLFPVWGWDDWRNLALPVIVGIVSGTGGGVRFYRTVFLNEIGKPYLRTAIAKGDSPFRVYFGHLLKNAAIPILTRASTVLPFLFTGSLLLESFFGIPGLGFRGVDALNSSDLQTLKALVILGAFLFVFINLLTDLAYAWVDPRVRPK